MKLLFKKVKSLYIDIIRFFPIQLFLLHFRKYQILIIFWALLLGILNGTVLKRFGLADILLAPEYFGEINVFSYFILGFSYGIFSIVWNITTFILHAKRFYFLATTKRPFLKYCINNAIIPLTVFLYYLIKIIQIQKNELLSNNADIILAILGFVIGFIILLFISFIYFFGADKGVVKSLTPILNVQKINNYDETKEIDRFGLKISYFISDKMRFRKTRSVSHYNPDFLDLIFKRHHITAIIIVFFSFVLLTVFSIFFGNSLFKIPASASLLILFALSVGVLGALSYFLESWSIVFVIVCLFVLNLLFKNDIIDPRNKAYGLNYNSKENRPKYNKQNIDALCTIDKTEIDKQNMLSVLNNWKQNQKEKKPILYIINASGGGLRSACFVTKCLQEMDRKFDGKLMDKTFMINGASGGMLAATYYSAWKNKYGDSISNKALQNKAMDNITADLLNPIMSSLVMRDIFAPVQKFTNNKQEYIKDRGFAFEQTLNENTQFLLNNSIENLSKEEFEAKRPLTIYSSTITADGKKMLISTQPISFLMKPASLITDTQYPADAIDYCALFEKQNAKAITQLTALRMNATFPYILPSVWLPSVPVIDVMDAGLRDNYGLETSYRFVNYFRKWIENNTSGVVFIQIIDREKDSWNIENNISNIADLTVKPATMLQLNYHKMVDYSYNNQFEYLQKSFTNNFVKQLTFQYIPKDKENAASLNFHITPKSKIDIINSFMHPINQNAIKTLNELEN